MHPKHAKECLQLKKSMCKYKDGTRKKCNCHRLKAQPGYAAGYKRIGKSKKYTCKNLHRRILADNLGIYKTKKDCKKGYYIYKRSQENPSKQWTVEPNHKTSRYFRSNLCRKIVFS